MTAALAARTSAWVLELAPVATDAPNHVPHVVSDKKGACLVDCYADRAPHGLVVTVDKAGEDVSWRADGSAVSERHEDHLVAAADAAVPRAMLADKSAIVEGWPECGAVRECQPQRGGVRAECIVRFDRLRDENWSRWPDALIDILAVVAVGPTIKGPSRTEVI